MTGHRDPGLPPPGTVPVVVPGDVVLARSTGLVVWAGAVTVYPEGFAFTLRTLWDARRTTPPAAWALDVAERDRMTWLEIRYPDGRARSADLNANTPHRQPRGPHLEFLSGEGSEGCDDSRWWVSPLPPPGRVELAIHLNGGQAATGAGHLDGGALVGASARTQSAWPGAGGETDLA